MPHRTTLHVDFSFLDELGNLSRDRCSTVDIQQSNDDSRREMRVLRLQDSDLAPHQKDTRIMLSFRSDFSRYPTVAVSEAGNQAWVFLIFFRQKASSECKTNAPFSILCL